MSARKAITEADVRAVLPAATLEVPVGSVVTPAARDLAKQLGVAIIEVKTAPQPEGRKSGAKPRSSRAAVLPAPVPAAPPPPAPAPPAPAPAATQQAAPAPAPKQRPTMALSSIKSLPQGDGRKIAVGADHGGFAMKEGLKAFLEKLGYAVHDVGTMTTDPVDYPDFAVAVAREVASGQAWRGIMVDGAGIGSAMAANKIAGIRAALCYDVTTAENAREHNDANVLTLGGTLIGERLAGEIVRTFLATDFGGGRHQKRVDKINALDK